MLLRTEAYARPLSFQANALKYMDLQKLKHTLEVFVKYTKDHVK